MNKMRLIDTDALEQKLLAIRKRIADKAGACVGLETAGQCISKAPKTDAESVRHGKWKKVRCDTILDKAVFSHALKCSECGKWKFENLLITQNFYYCPNCGAKMDGDGENA